MTLTEKMAAIFAAAGFLCTGICPAAAQGQEEEFDLTQQRYEPQYINPVPGKAIDHKGIILNPTPHIMETTGDGSVDISSGIRIKDRQGCFSSDLKDLVRSGKGPVLSIDFGEKQAAKAGVKAISGAYSLTIDGKGIKVTGYDEDGAFYGIQTLKQLINNGKLPYIHINDWPDLPFRGVVEGFYGTPWSHEIRLSLIDFYGKFKMNTYVYGPKDDPYHSSPDWRKPYPAEEAEKIKELVEACKANHVDFVWAIHPGQDIRWDEEDYGRLVGKFQMMYDLGVRAFAIFFDDISGEGTNPVKQVELLNRLNKEFIHEKGDVAPLIMCPTDYSKLWANPSPEGPLSIYGKTLDPSVLIFWTGDSVCSDFTAETLEWVDSRTKRSALFWWNFPVTDYVRHIIMEGPAYGLDSTITSDMAAGILSNPMEHGEASKVALYGLADYSWNVSGYNPMDSWERAIAFLVPEARDAFRTFAIHSCDTETGYRRDESWETETFSIYDYTQDEFEALRDEFQKVTEAPDMLLSTCRDSLLMKEIGPWLVEFRKLGERGSRTLDLIAMKDTAPAAGFWSAYVRNLMTTDERAAYEAHKSGTYKLQPFYENAMDDMGRDFYRNRTGESPAVRFGIGSFANINTILNKLMFDNDTTTYYTSGYAQKNGDWIGADLGGVIPVREISILQGRNSVDDVDYFDHARLEYSTDGKTWTPLIDDIEGQYVIKWKGEPFLARYVRLYKLESPKTNWASVRSFDINPVTPESLGMEIKANDLSRAMAAFDRNTSTCCPCGEGLTFSVPVKASECTLLLRQTDAGKIEVTQKAADGSVISCEETSDDYFSFGINENAAEVELTGDADIFEIIFGIPAEEAPTAGE